MFYSHVGQTTTARQVNAGQCETVRSGAVSRPEQEGLVRDVCTHGQVEVL